MEAARSTLFAEWNEVLTFSLPFESVERLRRSSAELVVDGGVFTDCDLIDKSSESGAPFWKRERESVEKVRGRGYK